MAFVKELEWDSKFFGYPIGEIIEIENSFSKSLISVKGDYIFLVCKVNSNAQFDNEICKKNGGILVDEKVTFTFRFDKKLDVQKQNNCTHIFKPETSRNKLYDLAFQSGEFSRFKLDPNFRDNEFEKLYKAWIDNSIDKLIANMVIIDDLSTTTGVLTLGEKNGAADIGILAVDHSMRGRGIGRKLIERAFYESLKMGYSEITVSTQKKNEKACHFYLKMGFSISKSENIYHFWNDSYIQNK